MFAFTALISLFVLDEYIRDNRKIFGQLVCSFRYGREEDEVMGLNFQKELYLASEQIYPARKTDMEPTKLQERLLKKLGPNAYAFTFNIPPSSPTSVSITQHQMENSTPCGVQYFVVNILSYFICLSYD